MCRNGAHVYKTHHSKSSYQLNVRQKSSVKLERGVLVLEIPGSGAMKFGTPSTA